MKRIIALILSVFVAQAALADTCQKQLMPAFTAAQAKALCTKLGTAVSTTMLPQTDDSVDLGSASLEFQDAFFDGVVTTDGLTSSGTITLDTTGTTLKLHDGTAASACMGTATANGTTAVTVSTTCASTGARIFLTQTSDGSGTAGNDQNGCWVTNIVNGTSFDLDCSDSAHNGTFNWIIFKDET